MNNTMHKNIYSIYDIPEIQSNNLEKNILSDPYFLHKLKQKYPMINDLDLFYFLKRYRLKLTPTKSIHYSYKNIINLIQKYPTFEKVKILYQECYQQGTQNYAKNNKIGMYYSLYILFYYYGLDVNKLKKYNLLRSSRLRAKSSRSK